jgi:hypothetical protein
MEPTTARTCQRKGGFAADEKLAVAVHQRVAMNATPERRTTGRRPFQMKVPCSAKKIIEEARWDIAVQNVSEDRIELTSDQPFRPGVFLAVDLPDVRNRSKLSLMRVTQSQPCPGKSVHLIEGIFVKRLPADDVAALRLKLRSPQKGKTRLPGRLKTCCRRIRVSQEGPWLMTTSNISARGIGLVTDQHIPRGTFLTVELPARDRRHLRPKLVRVTHARQQAGEPGWVLGGVFLKHLSEDELRVLV